MNHQARQRGCFVGRTRLSGMRTARRTQLDARSVPHQRPMEGHHALHRASARYDDLPSLHGRPEGPRLRTRSPFFMRNALCHGTSRQMASRFALDHMPGRTEAGTGHRSRGFGPGRAQLLRWIRARQYKPYRHEFYKSTNVHGITIAHDDCGCCDDD